MIILGMKVIVDERAPEGQVLHVSPRHKWNPTDMDALVCRAKTLEEVENDPEKRRAVEYTIRQIRIAKFRQARAFN